MCTVLVTETMACLVSVGELGWFLMCPILVTEMVACLVSEGELGWFLMCPNLVTEPGLSCFRM